MRSKAIIVLFLVLLVVLLASCAGRPSYLWRITTCSGVATQVRATGCEMAYSTERGNTVTCWMGWHETASIANACALERLGEGQP